MWFLVKKTIFARLLVAISKKNDYNIDIPNNLYYKEIIPMNKTEMIAKVAKDAGITKDQASKAVNAVFDSIKGALAKGDKVQLIGFGTFGVKECAAREVRIPATGEKKMAPATKRPKFTAGQGLKDAVAKK